MQTKARFSLKRHGLWVFFTIGCRLVYMFVFTFFFFGILFETINQESFDVLSQYNTFAKERDSQLLNFSQAIAAYYYSLVLFFTLCIY